MKQEADLLIKSLSLTLPKREGIMKDTSSSNKSEENICLQNYYTITFLGKGWEEHVETLRKAGYEVNHIKFAPDYIEEICKHDIQITPISIGTGTKGKVLDALANGLLVIGTPYAMENIAVENGVSCIEYREPQEVIEVLLDIVKNGNENDNREKFETMAAAGREAVLSLHSPEKVAKELFNVNNNVN